MVSQTQQLGSLRPATTGKLPIWFYEVVLLVSAGAFAVSSALAKLVVQGGVSAPEITFWRFFVGWVAIVIYIAITRPRLRPRNLPSLFLRAVFNLAAVFLFYCAVKYTTITKANLLNLTYPVFVALLGPILLHEPSKPGDWLILVGAGIGVYLVINPNFQRVNIGDVLGLACGLTAGFAVICLRWARRSNHTVTVLLFLLTTGVILTCPAIVKGNFLTYTPGLWGLVVACGASGVFGQFAITLAFRHVSAFAGSVLGLSRVVMAAVIGLLWLGESLTLNVVVGAIVVIGSILILARRTGCVDRT